MTETTIGAGTRPVHQVGDRVQIHRDGHIQRGRVNSIHRVSGGIEYVVHADAAGGGIGGVLNVWTSDVRTPFLASANDGTTR